MQEKLDIYVDAGKVKDWGIGILAEKNGHEILRVSESIPAKLGITDSNNAELYAISRALKEVITANINDTIITVYTDNISALAAAVGSRFKNCLDLIYSHICTFRGQITKIHNNELLFTKLTSEYNHSKAHNIATDGSNGNIYRAGDLTTEIENPENPINEVAVSLEENDEDESSLFNGLNISYMLKQAEIQFKTTSTILKNKEAQLNELKSKIELTKIRIDKLTESNEVLAAENNSNNLEFEKTLALVEAKKVELDNSRATLKIQNAEISKKTEEQKRLSNQLKAMQFEKGMKIKFLKEDFERLSYKKHYIETVLDLEIDKNESKQAYLI